MTTLSSRMGIGVGMRPIPLTPRNDGTSQRFLNHGRTAAAVAIRPIGGGRFVAPSKKASGGELIPALGNHERS